MFRAFCFYPSFQIPADVLIPHTILHTRILHTSLILVSYVYVSWYYDLTSIYPFIYTYILHIHIYILHTDFFFLSPSETPCSCAYPVHTYRHTDRQTTVHTVHTVHTDKVFATLIPFIFFVSVQTYQRERYTRHKDPPPPLPQDEAFE